MSYALLEPAAAALEAGQKLKARSILEQVIREDRHSELGWLLLSKAAETDRERRSCLVRVLAINPQNAVALRMLAEMETNRGESRLVQTADLSDTRLRPMPDIPQLRRTEAPAKSKAREIPASPGLAATVYLAGITLAELCTTFLDPNLGLILHAILLVALLVHAALTWESPLHRLLLPLTLAPLIRLLSLTLPLKAFPVLYYWYFIVSVPLFAAAFSVVRLLKLRAADLGLSLRYPLAQALVIFTGVIFGYAEYQIIRPTPLIGSLTLAEFWLPALILMVSTGFAEEFIFRGIMQKTAAEVIGKWAVVYTSALFAVLHIGYKSALDVLFVFVVALIFGWFRERTGSILGITLAHGWTNIFLFLLMPFLLP